MCADESYGIHSFVDRDMFMRFRGGGVGHRTQPMGSNAPVATEGSLEADGAADGSEEPTIDEEELQPTSLPEDMEDGMGDEVEEEPVEEHFDDGEDDYG